MPTASICAIIPAFQAESFIERALDSVLKQTHPLDEVLIVDDASTDGTADRIERYLQALKRPHWRLIRQDKNRGPAAARNLAAQHSTSTYLAFLDADDIWLPHAIQHASLVMQEHHLTLFGAQFGASSSPEISPNAGQGTLRPIQLRQLMMRNYFYTSTAVVLRQDFLLAGGFPESFRYSEDFRLWLTLCARHPGRCAVSEEAHALYNPAPPAPHASHTSSRSTARLSTQLWAMEKAELANFRWLRSERHIGPGVWLAASVWSGLKFLIRCARATIRHR